MSQEVEAGEVNSEEESDVDELTQQRRSFVVEDEVDYDDGEIEV